MSVVVIGVDHQRAPLEVLEQVTISDEQMGKVLGELRGYGNLSELVVVSTCLRTEVYAVVERFHDAVDEITEVLAAHGEIDPEALRPLLTIFYDYDVATHLFSVAAGLQSSVPGESEVLGQVRRAFDRSLAEHTSGPVLAELFRAALHAGKRVRSETGIARGTTSFAHAAVELAERHIGGFGGRHLVVVGTGDLGTGVLRAVASKEGPDAPSSVVVSNRTVGHAHDLLAQLEFDAAVVHLDQLRDAVMRADVVVTAVDAERPVLDVAELGGRVGPPLLVVDLGVPRNVAPEVRAIPGITVLDVTDLQGVVDHAVAERRSEFDAAGAIVNEEVHRYRDVARARGAAPVVASLRQRFEALRAAEVERRRSDFGELDAAEWAKVDALTRSVLAKVLHEPTVVVKESAGTPKGERLVEALRALFDL